MYILDQVLVKYCFSELKGGILENKENYYSAIITELETEGVIQNICKYECESPFGFDDEKIVTMYQVEACEKYMYILFLAMKSGKKKRMLSIS